VHELGIANEILHAVEEEARRNGNARPYCVGVKIGVAAAVNEDALRFAFEMATRDTPLEGLKLDIENCPVRCRCLDCGVAFDVNDFMPECPKCKSASVECIGGDELELAYLEVEDEACKAREKGAE
jgi:hydrogenase nickel incorporation protein HypA/HybF